VSQRAGRGRLRANCLLSAPARQEGLHAVTRLHMRAWLAALISMMEPSRIGACTPAVALKKPPPLRPEQSPAGGGCGGGFGP
jgi:hypothetical protein